MHAAICWSVSGCENTTKIWSGSKQKESDAYARCWTLKKNLCHEEFWLCETWAYIRQLLGPGLHWGRTQEELLTAIETARAAGKHTAAAHIEIILDMRNHVMCEEKTPRSVRGEDSC